MRKPRKFTRRRQQDPHRINEHIRASRVRVVGENVEQDVYSLQEARKMAEEKGLDLVEISPNADPPVCKIIDYKKFLYEKKKKEKELKSKASKTTIKEIRFGPNTDDHDLEFKTNHARKFLEEGSKVKAYVHFRGRAIVFKDRGELLLLKFAESLSDVGSLEQMPKMEGKRMNIMISPKKGK